MSSHTAPLRANNVSVRPSRPTGRRRRGLAVAAVALATFAPAGLAAAAGTQPAVPSGKIEQTNAATRAASPSGATDPFVCRDYTHSAVGRLSDTSLTEISGMARGRRDQSVMWMHEDSGAKADVYAMSLTGQKRQTFRLSGVAARDWEDMDIGRGPQSGVDYLYLGDIGGRNRATITINRVAEPNVTGASGLTELGGIQQIEARYPDGPRNAEAMAVGADGTIYIFSKEASTRVYEIPYPQSTSSVITMRRIDSGVLASRTDVSGADIRPDGRALIVRGYRMAWQWPIVPGESMATTLRRTPCNTPTYRDEKQGEAIAFLGNDGSYTSVGEASGAVVRHYTL